MKNNDPLDEYGLNEAVKKLMVDAYTKALKSGTTKDEMQLAFATVSAEAMIAFTTGISKVLVVGNCPSSLDDEAKNAIGNKLFRCINEFLMKLQSSLSEAVHETIQEHGDDFKRRN